MSCNTFCLSRKQFFQPSTSFSLVYEKKKQCKVYNPNTCTSSSNHVLDRKNRILKRFQENNKNNLRNDIFIKSGCEKIKNIPQKGKKISCIFK